MAHAFATENDLTWMETSAKTGYNIEQAFTTMSVLLYEAAFGPLPESIYEETPKRNDEASANRQEANKDAADKKGRVLLPLT